MIGTLLVRGMLVGILAGVLAFGFARVFGEAQVDRAIAFEESHSEGDAVAETVAAQDRADTADHDHAAMTDMAAADHHHGGDEELVSRPTQAGIGLFTAVVVYGAAFGGIFALVFAFAWGRAGVSDPRALAALIALAGFVVLIVVPMIKYPANPPAVGNGDTIGARTALYFAMLVASLFAVAVGLFIRSQLARAWGAWNASLAGIAAFVAVAVAAMLILPAVNEVPEAFPASLLWQFRIASLGTQAVLWTTLGLAFGALTQRSPARA
jgi:predicted cobalt transporter CbtA